jgi:hypothetical protein
MIENVYELSPLQEGIYYHWLADDSSSLYFEQISYRVRAKVLDIEKLKGAYDQLTARHAVLRTSFSTEYAGRSLQIVRKEVPSAFTYEKLGRAAEQQALVETIKQQDRDRGYYLKGYSSPAEMPFKARAADSAYVESSEHLQIRGDLFKKVDALCTELGITHNTFVHGVWGYLLSRYNNTNDVVFGAVVSGRPADLPGVEEMIELFIKTRKNNVLQMISFLQDLMVNFYNEVYHCLHIINNSRYIMKIKSG